MKRVKGKFVNIVDLVDKGKTGFSVTQFDNLEVLRKGVCVRWRSAETLASRNSQQAREWHDASQSVKCRELCRMDSVLHNTLTL